MFGESLLPVDYNLAGVLHYLQAEWRRFERERNEWTIERAELKARVALLEGERRGVEKLKVDMIKRMKMLEYALRQERKQSLGSSIQHPPANVMDDKVEVDISGYPGPSSPQKYQNTSTSIGSPVTPTAKVMAHTKLREGSRQALKTCLQEINYLTSLPSKLPLTYTLATSIKSSTKPVNTSMQSSPCNASTRTYTSQPSLSNFTSDKPFANINTSGIQKEESDVSGNKMNEPRTATITKPYSPPLPSPLTASTPPAIDEVYLSPAQKNPLIRRDSAIPANDEGLSDSIKEKYNISSENMQKVMKNANKKARPMETDMDTKSDSVWKTKMVFKGHLDSVRAVAFHPSDMLLASGSDDGTVKIINFEPGKSTTKKLNEDLDAIATYRGHSHCVTKVAVSGDRVYSSSLDATLRIWQLPPPHHTTFSPVDPTIHITTLIGHTDAIWDFELSPTHPFLLASASADGTVKLWNTQGHKKLLQSSWGYNQQQVVPTSLAFCGATTLAVSYTNAKIQLVDIETSKVILTCTGSDDAYDATRHTQINTIVHRQPNMLISGHEDRRIQFYDINSGRSTATMSAHLDGVTSLDTQGSTLASGGHDTSIRLWDLKMAHTCLQEFTTHRKKGDEGVLDLMYHPTLPWLASGGADGIVKLYHH